MNSDTRAPKMRRDSMSRPVAVGAEHEAPGAARLPDRRRPHRVAKLLDRRMGRDDSRANSGEHDDEAEDGRPNTAPRFSRNAAQKDASGEGWARTAAATSAIVRRQRGGVSGHGESAD